MGIEPWVGIDVWLTGRGSFTFLIIFFTPRYLVKREKPGRFI